MNNDYMYLLVDLNGRSIALFKNQDEADMASNLVKNTKVKKMRVRGSYLDYGRQEDSKLKPIRY